MARHTVDLEDAPSAATIKALKDAGICQYWPDAKAALKIVKTIVPAAGLVIDWIIRAGNAACPAG